MTIINHLKKLLFSSILCILQSFISCSREEYCICYIYEKGVPIRIDDSESGNCESESNTIDESNYPICHLSYDGGLPFQPQ